MPEQLLKFSPHRDLQCYCFQPSAIAALSNATATGFTLSGSWRQQWDWAVVEWNRDNVFEHPSLRYLPDLGTNDLSGLTVSYIEQRTNCVSLESNIYPSLDWPYLRFWVPKQDGTDDVYYVRLSDSQYWAPAAGAAYQNATVAMTLTGTVTPGLRVGLAFTGTYASNTSGVEQNYSYSPTATDSTLADVAVGLASAISAGSPDMTASSDGAKVICTYVGAGALQGKTGANANRIGVYGYAQSGSQTAWVELAATFSGGQFPQRYQITLPFGNLQGVLNDPSQFSAATIPYVPVPTQNVRKVRWTWAAELQPGPFQRTEFQVLVSDWTVTGANRIYSVAGPGSRRIEDDDGSVTYSSMDGESDWNSEGPGNYSGSRINTSQKTGAACSTTYTEPAAHRLYLGTRRLAGAPSITVSIDSGTPATFNLQLPGEDVMARVPLGELSAGTHTVVITHNGSSPNSSGDPSPFYFDFLEIAYPAQDLPDFAAQNQLSLATDWDTLHSQALPAERTAWLIWKLGFHGRVNHYTGALWFYELTRPGQQFAGLTATINAPANPTGLTEIDLGSAPFTTTVQHQNLPDDTSVTIAQALAQLINQGTAAVWASAAENVLTITWRFIETDPALPTDPLPVSSTSANGNVTVSLSAGSLSGGSPGYEVGYAPGDPIQVFTAYWRTDLAYSLRLNRACRDWSGAFFTALKLYGIDAVAAFSTELAHADPTPAAGIAQRYPDTSPVVVSTPAVQTNFSPVSLAFWQVVYTNMAALQQAAGMIPYLQSGEVQWWYNPDPSGMPFYDDYTKQAFASAYGAEMAVILTNDAKPEDFPNEAALLPTLLGGFTVGLRNALKTAYPNARYEVLYPGDVNTPSFNAVVNFPTSDWTPSNLTCLKTEGLSYMATRNLDGSLQCIQLPLASAFSNSQRSHLVTINDAQAPWMREADLAQAQAFESVVLFALDQYCLIGYPAPPFVRQRWSRRAA